MSGRCGVVLIALGLSIRVSEAAGPVSGDGCACASACGKSWHNSGGEWCYVAKQCKNAGWDACQNAAMLYSEGKANAEKTTESKSLWQRLKDQLKQTETKELEEEAALTVAQAKLKKNQQHSSEEESELRVVKKHEAEERVALATTQTQLKTSELKVDTLKKQLRSALEKEAEAEVKATAAESKERTTSSSAAQKQAEGEKVVREAQKKADDAEAKRKEEHAKVMTSQATHHKDEIKHQKDAMKLSDTELRLSGKDKQLLKTDKKAKEAYTKFKVTEKAMLKVKAQASETEKKLAASISENAKMKDVQKKYVDTQKKLEVAEMQKQKAYAELKPLHTAILKAVLA